jgi:spore photoproduct lyase
VLSRLPKSRLVRVEDYKRVFNRSRQCFRDQKKSAKIILAVKRPPYLYPGSDQCQKYDNDDIYYVTPVLNCLYDCKYCYLQGMYESANIVLFVNNEDVLMAVKKAVKDRKNKKRPLYVSISYDTDLMLFERLTGYCGEWLSFALKEPNVTIELRTKSAGFKNIEKHEPPPNVILAWTMSPEIIARTYEKKAPSIESRLSAAERAVSNGWAVRLCFDPVIPVPNWQCEYDKLLKYIFHRISPENILDVTTGPFRMNEVHFRRIRKMRRDCDLYFGDFDKYREEISEVMVKALSRYLPKEKIVPFNGKK